MSDQKKHPATPARRKQAMEAGDGAHSRELGIAFELMVAIASAWLLFGGLGKSLLHTTTKLWSSSGISADGDQMIDQIRSLTFGLVMMLLPMLCAVLVAGWMSQWLQRGCRIGKPELSLGGMPGSRWLSGVFSAQGFSVPLVTAPRIVLAIVVAGVSVWVRRDDFLMLGAMNPLAMTDQLFRLVMGITTNVAVFLLASAIGDYVIKRISFERRIRMTDQELRDELRMTNGDPVIKQQQKSLRRV